MIIVKLRKSNAEENAKILLSKALRGEEVEISEWEELEWFQSMLSDLKRYDVAYYRQELDGRIVDYDYKLMHECLSNKIECRPYN